MKRELRVWNTNTKTYENRTVKLKGMKGLGYEFVLFIGVFIFLLFIWMFGYYAFGEVADSFIDISTDSTLDSHISTIKTTVYWSFFFITLLGFIWVIKSSLKKNQYGNQ